MEEVPTLDTEIICVLKAKSKLNRVIQTQEFILSGQNGRNALQLVMEEHKCVRDSTLAPVIWTNRLKTAILTQVIIMNGLVGPNAQYHAAKELIPG